MKRIQIPSLILSAGLILTGCSSPIMPTSDHTRPTQNNPKTELTAKKDPASIVFINTVVTHYSVVGEATVSKYNVAGIKRQKAVIQDRLRELAASMGGDAIIDLKSEGRYVTGTVIVSDESSHV